MYHTNYLKAKFVIPHITNLSKSVLLCILFTSLSRFYQHQTDMNETFVDDRLAIRTYFPSFSTSWILRSVKDALQTNRLLYSDLLTKLYSTSEEPTKPCTTQALPHYTLVISEEYTLLPMTFMLYTVWVKKISPGRPDIFSFIYKRLRIFNRFLHTCYTFLSTLDYKFLFSYPWFWRSYAKRD